MRWILQNISFLLPALVVIFSALGPVFKALAEKREAARLRRARGGWDPEPAGGGFAGVERAPASPRVERLEDDLTAQRRAQIEMWRAREAMMRGEGAAAPQPMPRSAEEELARRRRLAMEELRRRQAAAATQQAPQAPPSRPQPSSQPRRPDDPRRQRAQQEAQRARQATRRPAEPEPQPAQRSISAVQRSAPPPQRRSPLAPPATRELRTVVPAARGSGFGSLVLTRDSLRQAFVMKELLDPPLAIRDMPGSSTGGYHQPF